MTSDEANAQIRRLEADRRRAERLTIEAQAKAYRFARTAGIAEDFVTRRGSRPN